MSGSAQSTVSASVESASATRTKRALWTTLTAILGRGLGMVLSLVSVPLTIGFLDKDRYGLWITVSSMLSWLTIADLGLGNGITNRLVAANAADDRDSAREVVTTSTSLLAAISLFLGVVFAISSPFVPWDKVFAAPAGVDQLELRATVVACVAIFLLGFPLGIIDKIYGAYQEGYVANYWSYLANFLSVVALVLVVRLARGLPLLVVALSGVPLLARFASAFYLFGRRRPWLRPVRGAFRRDLARDLLKTGSRFLLIQLIVIAMWQNDNFIVAQLFGAGEVGRYSLAFRLGTTYIGLVSMWTGPLWPAYADAVARRDLEWIQKHISRTRRLVTGATVVAAIVCTAVGATVIRIWTRTTAFEPSRSLLAAVGVYMVLMVWCLINAAALNGLGRLRGQLIYGAIAAVVNIVLSILLGRWLGSAGVCWATCVAALITTVGTAIELDSELAKLARPQTAEAS